MILIEFLNRISFFSILAWGFYLIAVLCAIVLTTSSSPLARKYRKSMIAILASSILLGTLSWSTPFFMRRLNPDQSRLTPIDQLTPTEWLEPVSNPEVELPNEEIAWAKKLSFQFKYKIDFKNEFLKVIAMENNTLVYLDQGGSLHGLNAYSGLNHWSIPLRSTQVLGIIQNQKKLFLMDRTSLDALRISCLDLNSPSLLWQRTIPNTKDGAITFDLDTQSLLVSAGTSGIWSLKSGNGEILWKRPELYTKNRVVSSQKHILAFEPVIAGRAGSWYFLDSLTGKTLQKSPHVFTEIQDFLTGDSTQGPLTSFLARMDAENYFILNPIDLSEPWTFHAESKIKLTRYLGLDRYLILYDSNLLEMRLLKDNALVWQKKLNLLNPNWMKVSPQQEWLTLPDSTEGEVPGVVFYGAETGDYLITARTTEPILDLQFFGDWLYLFSENHLWAFKK